MEKFYSNYKQSVDLKILGFDEECHGCYNEDKKLIRMLPLVTNSQYPKFPTAPTYEHVIDWAFRTHGIYIISEPVIELPERMFSGDKFVFNIYSSEKGYNEELGLDDGIYSLDDIRPAIVSRIIELILEKNEKTK